MKWITRPASNVNRVALQARRSRPRLHWVRPVLASALVSALAAAAAQAQDQYLNTGMGRPLRTEDASAIDRYRLDAQFGPVTWERSAAASAWQVTPAVEYGLLPRTQVQVALPFGGRSVDGRANSGVDHLELSGLYALNDETRSFPALAVRARALVPVGQFGIQQGHSSVAALITETFPWGRLSVNHEYMFGTEPDSSLAASSRFTVLGVPRWRTSASVDRALPIQGLLFGAEGFAQQALQAGEKTRWNLGAGLRYQLTRQMILYASVNAGVSGPSRPMAVSVGLTRASSVAGLFPGLGRWER